MLNFLQELGGKILNPDSLIQTGSSLLSGFLSNRYAQKNYERAASDSRAAWQAAADYNSPVQQVRRLEAAGINPQAAFGSGAGAAIMEMQPANVPSPPQAPSFNALGPLAPLSVARTQQARAQTAQTTQLLDLYDLVREGKSLENEGTRWNNQISSLEFRIRGLIADVEPEKLSLELAKLSSEIDLLASQRGLNERQRTYLDDLSRLARTSSDLNETKSIESLASARLSREKADTESLNRQNIVDKTKAETLLRESETALNESKLHNVRQEFLNLVEVGRYTEAQARKALAEIDNMNDRMLLDKAKATSSEIREWLKLLLESFK